VARKDAFLDALQEDFRKEVSQETFELDLSEFSRFNEVWHIKPMTPRQVDEISRLAMSHSPIESLILSMVHRAHVQDEVSGNLRRRFFPADVPRMLDKTSRKFWQALAERVNIHRELEIEAELSVEEMAGNSTPTDGQ
jgi:hypothetical protein